MRKPLLALFVFFVITGFRSAAQQSYPSGYFISPVDFPISLSGTFAELRSNHFHSGIDIRTQGAEGKKIVACADGYVSRIKVSPYGFGKALYITHPNGFTTVYGHLRSYNPTIDAWVKSEQYRLEQFDVDLFPPKNLLTVKQGELICYSGNSGSSQGPHLHFEIRHSGNEWPVDPLLFGIPVKDFVRPVITTVRLYPEGETSAVNGKITPLDFETAGWGPVYRLKNQDTIRISGSFSLGLQAHDLQSGSNNKNGISSIAVYVDSVLRFSWEAETFSFPETRYINSLIDYAQYIKNGQRFIRTKILPNSQLSMYKYAGQHGIFEVKPGVQASIKMVVSDAQKNESVMRFVVKGEEKGKTTAMAPDSRPLFSCKKANTFQEKGIQLRIPANGLYEDLNFTYKVLKRLPASCSALHQLHSPDVPLHDYADISVTVDSAFRYLGNKLVIANVKQGKKPVSVGGKFENGKINGRIREFGQYTVMADTTAPVIIALNISDGKNISSQKSIRMAISDNFSGIQTYRGTLNGQWILMDYDAKNRLLEYQFDDRLIKGKNEFILTVEDGCGNSNTYKANLIN
ncbi:MAG: M23 family metallopeptidase [Lentimicrobiaceae bacterium]|nr:M23 family metallopeptidase [Lentimicrobiaceae bacterium]MCO5264965.1 M23 family metallopeptidase [Lentimicrobium sp.]